MAPKKPVRGSRGGPVEGRGGRVSAVEAKRLPKKELVPDAVAVQKETIRGATAPPSPCESTKKDVSQETQKRLLPPAKRAKIEEVVHDPYTELCETVGAGLSAATKELPSSCHDLFRALAVGCLPTPQSERHALQNAAVDILSSAMTDVEASRARIVEMAQSGVDEALRKKESLDEVWRASLAQAKTKRAHANEKNAMLVGLREADVKASAEIAEMVKARESHAAEAIALVEEKAACEGALVFELVLVKDGASIVKNGAFIRPDDPKHVAKLQSLIARIGLDDSLLEAFPLAAEKPVPFRSDFDKAVFPQVQTALENHIQRLHDKIMSSDPSAVQAQDDEAIRLAEMSSALAHEQSEAAAGELTLAQQEADKAESEASFAEKKAKEGADMLARAEKWLEEANATLASFKNGTLKSFHELRDRKSDLICPAT